jgi:hypothetical protein
LRRIVIQARMPEHAMFERRELDWRGQQAQRIGLRELTRQARGHGVDPIRLAHDDRRDEEIGDAQRDAALKATLREVAVDADCRHSWRRIGGLHSRAEAAERMRGTTPLETTLRALLD